MNDLQKLSFAASGGPWSVEALPHRIDIDGGNGGWLFRVGVGDDFTTEMHPGDYNATLADADFVVALVNAYRSGALVHSPRDEHECGHCNGSGWTGGIQPDPCGECGGGRVLVPVTPTPGLVRPWSCRCAPCGADITAATKRELDVKVAAHAAECDRGTATPADQPERCKHGKTSMHQYEDKDYNPMSPANLARVCPGPAPADQGEKP